MSVAEKPMTIEEFAKLPEDGVPRELVRGKATEMNIPTPRHGFVCSRVSRLVGNHVEGNDLGRVMTNDSGVVTGRDPDSLRGADV